MELIVKFLEAAFFADLALRLASRDEGPSATFFGVGANSLEG